MLKCGYLTVKVNCNNFFFEIVETALAEEIKLFL